MFTHKTKISRVAPKWLRLESHWAGQGLWSLQFWPQQVGPDSWASCPLPTLHGHPCSQQVPGHGSLSPPGSRQCTMSCLFSLPGCVGPAHSQTLPPVLTLGPSL